MDVNLILAVATARYLDSGDTSVAGLFLLLVWGGLMTVLFCWLPRAERWARFREQRRAMVPYRISPKRFEQLERVNAILLPLFGLLFTITIAVTILARAN